MVSKWWDCMPKSPSPEHVALAVRFSTWVLEKQSQRKGLVRRLLCLDEDGDVCLLPNAETVLTEPYAGGYRRVFFPTNPAVAPMYETQGATASRTDWRSFFEKLEPPPAGGFHLNLNAKLLSGWELARLVGGNYHPPAKRGTWTRAQEWRGCKVQWDSYTVVDASLPPVLDTILRGAVTRDQFSAMAQWLGESPSMLSDYGSILVAYIPQRLWSATYERLPKNAQWVAKLIAAAWVYAKNGEGPFRPCDILPGEDPARPDAPVAALSGEVVAALRRSGIEFGSELPDAPAIDRLRIQGPTAPADQLLEFLQAAIAEAGDDEKKKGFLQKTLQEQRLFPLPPGRGAVDGAVRVPHGRLVWNDARSVFGNWLVPIESFPPESTDRKLLELVDSFLPVPPTTTSSQSLDFLSWVWSATPNANLVRQLLPRAYQYVKEDLPTDKSLLERWKAVLQDVRVFVQGKTKWVHVVGSDNLFLDDLNESLLEDILVNVDFATPGHFADNTVDQLAVARLLGVNLLSSRFRIAVEPKGSLGVPNHWQQGFGAIQNWLRGKLKDEDDTGSVARGVPQHNTKLSRWQTLRTVVYDCGSQVHERQVKASVKDGSIAVSGSPDEFAEELCKVLFTHWGLRLRRNLVDLLPRVAIQLTKLDQEEAVAKWLTKTPDDTNEPPLAGGEELPGTPEPRCQAQPISRPVRTGWLVRARRLVRVRRNRCPEHPEGMRGRSTCGRWWEPGRNKWTSTGDTSRRGRARRGGRRGRKGRQPHSR